jgi:hypothetical protein
VYAQHQNRKINIGLRIKFTRKGQQMLGYTQRIETPSTNGISRGYWMYSAKALDLVYEFMQRFPDLFQALEADDAQEIEVFSPEMLFPNGNAAERMTEVCAAFAPSQSWPSSFVPRYFLLFYFFYFFLWVQLTVRDTSRWRSG